MNNEKFILQEEIKRMKELSTYDKSKTLNEQGSADINMDRVNQQQLAQAPEVKTIVSPQTDIKTKKFPCFTSTSVPYDYNPKRGDTVGNYAPAKMDFLRMFQDNSIIVAWENGTIKQYVRNGNSAGAETKKGTWKCKSNNSGVDVVMNNSVAEKQIPKKQISITDPNIINSLTFEYTYPGDTKFVYANQNGTWYGKNVTTNKVYDITKNYPASAKNLESGAILKEPELPEKPLAPNPESEAGAEPPQ